MGHAYKRQRLIGTHISVPVGRKHYCTTDNRDNRYSRQKYPVPRRPIYAASTVSLLRIIFWGQCTNFQIYEYKKTPTSLHNHVPGRSINC